MSDVHLRELERRRHEGHEAEARWLNAKIKAAKLDKAMVELAAYCGHEPSKMALTGGDQHPCGCWRPAGTSPPCLHSDVGEWVAALRERWGADAMVRAALAASREALSEELLENGDPHANGSGCPGGRVCSELCAGRRAVGLISAWISDQSEANRSACQIAGRVEMAGAAHMPYYIESILWGVSAQMPINVQHGRERHYERSISTSVRVAGHDAVRRVIRRTLIDWALSA